MSSEACVQTEVEGQQEDDLHAVTTRPTTPPPVKMMAEMQTQTTPKKERKSYSALRIRLEHLSTPVPLRSALDMRATGT